MVAIREDHGDDPAAYETTERDEVVVGARVRVLAHKPNGDCVYLGPDGCTIHGRAPAVCREFDCRLAFIMVQGALREARANGMFSRPVLRAGRKRIGTLDPAEARLALEFRHRSLSVKIARDQTQITVRGLGW